MSLASQRGTAERTIRKIDIAQVSLSLQDRLGLAKVKYENGRLRRLDSKDHDQQDALGSDKPSDSSSELAYSRYETPLTSSPTRNATFSNELPRSARNKHAATFNPGVMQPMLNASRKRVRSNSITERPVKAPRLSWKSSHRLPESSPGFSRPLPIYSNHPPSYDVATSGNSDEDNDPDLPAHSFQNVSSSMVSSSPPRTPPLRPARLQRNDKDLENEDGADLLLYLANSPTPARVSNKAQNRDIPPSTPPSQYAVLPSLTPTPGGGVFANFGTPSQQFNFADFVNVTPSPAQRPWGGRTPGSLSKTPLARSARRSLNFDNLVPPGAESPTGRGKDSGLALQLGEELRP
ncbi:hypothetical protein VTN77DRAFT_7490 [Rasamsonia byssochlamydoides]|uniref:uncharacterized protein n=1 Tax=Rasamsonia byssochlamydoides TaxID=89139 RepID=UPI003743882F